MKKIGLLLIPFVLASCNYGSTQAERPYTINLTNLGYEIDEKGKITIPSVTASLYSAAGALDVQSINFTAVLLDSTGKEAALKNSTIVPATGTLFGTARGGYICATTSPSQCRMSSSDANYVLTGPVQWPENTVSKAIVPGEWAVAHVTANTRETAGWYAEFTFTAVTSNKKTVTWKQNYQFIAPAK